MTSLLGPAPGVGTTVEVAEIESLSKGSLIVGDGTGAPAELAVGANGTIPVADSAEATGLKWQTASVTTKGAVELSTTAEIDTGIDSTRAMPVDQFQASKHTVKFLAFRLVASDTAVAVDTTVGGDFRIPFSGTILQDDSTPHLFAAVNDTAGTTGTQVVDVNLNGTTIMTTNKLDTDTTEKSSATGATLPDLTTTAVSAGDILTFDVDAIHTTPANGLTIYMAIRLTSL